MRIEDKRSMTKLHGLDNGECFKWEGGLYIKLSIAMRTDPGLYYTCVNIESGLPVALGYGTEVEPVNAKVVIE